MVVTFVIAPLAMGASCGGMSSADAKPTSMRERLAALVAKDSRKDQDPCTLITAAEMSRWVGTLATPQFRANDDGTPNTAGERCVYRGADGREVTIWTQSGGGRAAGKAMRDIPATLGSGLAKGGATGMDTMTNRVMDGNNAGPWDQATWIPGGSLMVTKGDAVLQVDMRVAGGRKDDALAIAKIAVPRIGKPLSYDGAKAVALAPKPRVAPKNACDLIPRAAVEAAIGKLAGAPNAEPDGKGCTYKVVTSEGERTYPVSYAWQGGRQSYAFAVNSMSTFGGITGLPSSSALDTLTPTGDMGKLMGGLVKMASGGSERSALGSSTKVGFKTDTTLKGPWDKAALLHGTQLLGLKGDVFVGLALETADYDRAKALLAAICSRI
jgi:hypothetical protein